MVKKKKRKVQTRRSSGRENTNILHPSHWQSHLRMERRAKRSKKLNVSKEAKSRRHERRLQIGQWLGVFAERHGKSSIWKINDGWSGDLLLSFCTQTKAYEFADGRKGLAPTAHIVPVMERAAGVWLRDIKHERSLVKTSRFEIAPAEAPHVWNINCPSTEMPMLSFSRMTVNSYEIVFPRLLAGKDISFGEIREMLTRRTNVSKLGSEISLREIGDDDFVTYQLVADRTLLTDQLADQVTPLRIGSALGRESIQRRLGEVFLAKLPAGNVEFEVVSIE